MYSMTDEQRAAVELARDVQRQVANMQIPVKDAKYLNAIEIIATLYLAEHPADDDEQQNNNDRVMLPASEVLRVLQCFAKDAQSADDGGFSTHAVNCARTIARRLGLPSDWSA